jgi:hypothetical protein
MRWISTVALQANLQGKDGTGEGENDSEGAHTPTRGRARLRVGGRAHLGRGVRTPRKGGARLGKGAHASGRGAHACEWRGAHAWEWGDAHAWGRCARLRVGGAHAYEGARTTGGEARMPATGGGAHTSGGGCARLGRGAHASGRGAHTWEWGDAHACEGGGAHDVVL